MQIQILRDDDARRLLADDELSREWERLYHACPWGSVFQSPAFVRTWYEVYRSTHTPVLVLARGEGKKLRGLLTLAHPDGQPRRLVAAGAHQAEYQVWLTEPADGDDFPLAAFEALAREFAGATLRLHFTTPNAPAAWLARASAPGQAFRIAARTVPRPLIDLGDLSSVEKMLSGEYYRRRQNWLKRNAGEIRIERVTDPAAFDALFDEFMPLCDLRQGARYGVLPFRDDPLKGPFTRALVRAGGVLEVSVLRAGDRVASVHIDGSNRGECELGMLAHEPSLSRGSPGGLHNLYLARELARDGWRAIDLTPGGAYKDELANRWDEVRSLELFFSERAHVAHLASTRVRVTAKRLLVRAGGSTERAREQLDELAASVRTPKRLAHLLAQRLWSSDTVQLLAIDAALARELSPTAAAAVARDDYAALGAYAPFGPRDPRRDEFLSLALRRLENGQVALTRGAGDTLAASAWVATGDKPVTLAGYDQPLALSAGVALLYELRFAPGTLGAEGAAVLRAMVAAAAEGTKTRRVVVAAQGTPLVSSLEQLGLRRTGALFRTTRFGTDRLWSSTSSDDVKVVEPPAAPAAPAAPEAPAAPTKPGKPGKPAAAAKEAPAATVASGQAGAA